MVVSPRGFLAFFLGKYLLRHFWALENLIADIKEFHENPWTVMCFSSSFELLFQPIRRIPHPESSIHYYADVSETLRWFLLLWFKVNLYKSHKQKLKPFGILAASNVVISVKMPNGFNFNIFALSFSKWFSPSSASDGKENMEKHNKSILTQKNPWVSILVN